MGCTSIPKIAADSTLANIFLLSSSGPPICLIFVTVHSVHSNLVKMHSKSPSVMAFCPVCLGILPYSCQNTSRNITCEQLLNCFLQHMLVFSSTILSFVLCRIVSVIIFCWNIIRFSEKKKNLPFICRLLKKDFCSDLIIIYCQSKLNCIFHIPNRNAHPACRLL